MSNYSEYLKEFLTEIDKYMGNPRPNETGLKFLKELKPLILEIQAQHEKAIKLTLDNSAKANEIRSNEAIVQEAEKKRDNFIKEYEQSVNQWKRSTNAEHAKQQRLIGEIKEIRTEMGVVRGEISDLETLTRVHEQNLKNFEHAKRYKDGETQRLIASIEKLIEETDLYSAFEE
jgi:hypothetical protein